MIVRYAAFTALGVAATIASIVGAVSIRSSTGQNPLSATTLPARVNASGSNIISSLPFVITKEGHYTLQRSLPYGEESGHAIRIDCNNVVVNLNGYSLRCTCQNPSRRNFGIYAQNQRNVTIRNGSIDGFYMGVWLRDISKNGKYIPQHGWHLLENLSLRDNTFRGLRIEGNACRIRRNQIGFTGGCKVFEDAYSMGIEAIGSMTTIVSNKVYETFTIEKGEAVGICLGSTWKGVSIKDNVVCNTKAPRFRSIGIWIGSDSSGWLQGNHIHKQTWAIAGNKNEQEVHCENNFITACDEAQR